MHSDATIHGDFHLREDGWAVGIERIESPNQDARSAADQVDLIVIHSISLPPCRFDGTAVQRLFCNTLETASHNYFASLADLKVSAHFLIDREGKLTQFVPVTARAWHAGRSVFRGREQCNDFSIGVELEGFESVTFTPAQYRSLTLLIAALCDHFDLLQTHQVVGHSDIAPNRKTDPGWTFDWPLLESRLGLQAGSLPARVQA